MDPWLTLELVSKQKLIHSEIVPLTTVIILLRYSGMDKSIPYGVNWVGGEATHQVEDDKKMVHNDNIGIRDNHTKKPNEINSR